jgi:DNA uptake protein ComE-like DNA-binding protein
MFNSKGELCSVMATRSGRFTTWEHRHGAEVAGWPKFSIFLQSDNSDRPPESAFNRAGFEYDCTLMAQMSNTAGALTVLAALLISGAAYCGRDIMLRPRAVTAAVDRDESFSVAEKAVMTCIDPETADWWQFATIPDIGEQLGRRIVEHREHVRRELPAGRRVFESGHDLNAVRGIGEKKLRAMLPFLSFG